MSFVQRAIDITLSLGTGSFGTTGSNTVKLTGLRASAMIEKYASLGANTAQIRVYGLTLDVMNQVSSLWQPLPTFRNNTIVVEAGDAASGMSVVFRGGILTAWANINMPDASLDMYALTAYEWLMRPVAALSFSGPTDAAVILSKLAATMGLKFENNGVSVILSNPYFPGPALQQANECASAANVEMAIDDDTLAIWPKGGTRGGGIPILSADAGMVGYPTYNGTGISVKTLYNPALRFGGQFQVTSQIKPATGKWNIWRLTHNLQSQTPGGSWFSEIDGKTTNV